MWVFAIWFGPVEAEMQCSSDIPIMEVFFFIILGFRTNGRQFWFPQSHGSKLVCCLLLFPKILSAHGIHSVGHHYKCSFTTVQLEKNPSKLARFVMAKIMTVSAKSSPALYFRTHKTSLCTLLKNVRHILSVHHCVFLQKNYSWTSSIVHSKIGKPFWLRNFPGS